MKPIALREIGLPRFRALKALYRGPRPLKLTIAGEPFSVTTAWPAADAGVAERAIIIFSIDGTPGELSLPRAIVKEWIVRIDPDADPAQLAPDHAALLLECVLTEDLIRLEAEFDCSIVLRTVDIGPADSAKDAFIFRLVYGGNAADCALIVDDSWAISLGKALDEAQKSAVPLRLDLPAAVSLLRGVASLSIAELQGLRPGDVIVPEEMNPAQDTAIAIFATRFIAPVRATEDGWLLTAGLSPIAATKWEWIMDQSKQPPAAALGDSDLEDLPLTVAFEVGRMGMSLKEISQLTPGAVIKITDVSDQAVDLLVNGKRIGRGEMVRIGDGVGVQVTRIFGDA